MSLPPPPFRAPRLFLWLGLFLLIACGGGGGCGGCACLSPIPGGYQGPTMDNAVAARVTNDGFVFMSQNFTDLLTQAGVANPMSLPVACSPQSGGNFCDQNRNGRCDSGEQCNVAVNITSFNLSPAAPTVADTGVIRGTMQLQIATGTMWYFRDCALRVLGVCVCDLACSANFSSTRSGSREETLSASVTFSIDAASGRILAFNVGTVGGLTSLESNDLNVGASGVCGTLTCGLVNIGFIKNIVVDQFLIPELRTQVQKAIDDARCRACSTAADCPSGATCSGGKCMRGTACVPALLGMEGRADLSQAGLGLPMSGAIDVYAVAGGNVSSAAASHFTAGVLGGAQPYSGAGDGGAALRGNALCVPPVAEPTGAISPPDWAAADGGYHVGLAIADRYVDQLMWATHQAGGLCIDIGTAQVALVSTGLFKPLLPSLGLVAPDDAPMLIALRPKAPPEVTIGKGTFDPITKQPIEPLLDVKWPDLDIDVYAMLDDRYVRLFRLVVDLRMPLSLVFEGCDKVTPALGDVKRLLTNVRAVESELLAEDPQALADLIPTLLALAEPSLAGALGSQTLPALGGFRLQVSEAKGITPISGTPAYEHLGLFATLLPPTGTCTTTSPQVSASLASAQVPTIEQVGAAGRAPLPWPTAVVKVSAAGTAVEYATRIDRGLWSTFAPAPGGSVTVTSAGLLVQGQHLIEVRAREAGAPHGVSRPVPVGLVVDLEAPRVTLREDVAADALLVLAHDAVTADSGLRFAYQFGAEAPSAFGPAQPLTLSSLEAKGSVVVLVEDEAGHVGQATWRAPTVALRQDEVLPASRPAPAAGCASAPGGAWALLAVVLLRRRGRGG